MTHVNIRLIPTKNFNFNFSLKRKKKMNDVKTQYVENSDVMSPWLIPAFDAYIKANIVEL